MFSQTSSIHTNLPLHVKVKLELMCKEQQTVVQWHHGYSPHQLEQG
jgi:hypothetical protein